MNNSETTSTPPFSVGTALRVAREQAGLSVADIASRIKFGTRQIEALEADDFLHLPEPTFVRGFVRSYARLLQIDENRLLDALPVTKTQTTVSLTTDLVDVPFPVHKLVNRTNLVWIAAALGVLLLLALFMWVRSSDVAEKPAVVVTEPLPLQDQALASSAAVVAATQESAEAVKTEPVVAVVEKVEPEKKTKPKKVVEPKKPAEPKKPVEPKKTEVPKEPAALPPVQAEPDTAVAPVPVAADKPVIPLEQLKRRPIHIIFNEDSWIEVIDANGVVLLSKLNRRGTEQWIGGPRRAPYDVSIARPGSVKLYYKGQEIDLSAYAATEVAHLKVE